MTFKKLALAAAIASVPAVGFSVEDLTVENLDESSLAGVTGQDGITMTIQPGAAGISANIYLHDKDGFGSGATAPLYGASYSWAGAIVVTGMSIGAGNTGGIVVTVDAADRAQTTAGNSAPILNVNVALPSALTIVTGDISVANSGRDDAPANFGVSGGTAPIINSTTVVLGATKLNIQLGNEVQAGFGAFSTTTDMVQINSTVTNGLLINNFRLNDVNSGGGMGAGSILVTDTGSTNTLSLKVGANITSAGLVLELGQVGTAAGGIDVNMTNVYLGTTTGKAIGDLSMVGLNLNGTSVTISGH